MDDTDISNKVSEMGFLESLRKRFSFSDAQVKNQIPNIQFVEGSIKNEDLKHVYKFLQENF
jgi:hypothetical protein